MKNETGPITRSLTKKLAGFGLRAIQAPYRSRDDWRRETFAIVDDRSRLVHAAWPLDWGLSVEDVQRFADRL